MRGEEDVERGILEEEKNGRGKERRGEEQKIDQNKEEYSIRYNSICIIYNIIIVI